MNALPHGDFRIVGETEDFLAVDKPAGLLVHPTKPGGPRTLWDGLRELLGYELATGGQVSLINRLDRETSGLVLVAKSAGAARAAGLAMQNGAFTKEYRALVFGWPAWDEWEVDAPLLRLGDVAASAVWLQRAVHPDGQSARTRFRVEARCRRRDGAAYAVVRAWPVTGRTHQIRVHLAHGGHPVVGDKLYVDSRFYLDFIRDGWTDALAEKLWLPRHALHAERLGFSLEGRSYDWYAPWPDDLRDGGSPAAFLRPGGQTGGTPVPPG
jgi:23S rRNA pseudouridine1911/1915/1917 synthase